MLRNYTQDMGSRCLLTISEIDLHVYWPFTVTNTFSEEFPTICSTLWRRQWQPTPVLLSGKSHGWRSLVGWSPWSHEESDAYWATLLSLFTFMHWRRKWQPTLVFLPGESQGQQSLVGCCLWGRTESDMTEAT